LTGFQATRRYARISTAKNRKRKEIWVRSIGARGW
jgi:hypothetical protein